MLNNDSKLDLLIVGHAVEDWIFNGTNEPFQKWGGIFNVNRSWITIASNHGVYNSKVGLEPSAYGHAFVKIDKPNAAKDVCASLNDRERNFKLFPTKWSHYCYLNEMENFGFDQRNGGILSADACSGRTLRSTYYFDYIFLSRDEHDPYRESICCSYGEGKKTVFIAHSPHVVEIWQSGIKLWESQPIERIKNCNVLGVGDHFAAAFIFAKSFLQKIDAHAVEFAIAKCREYLLSN